MLRLMHVHAHPDDESSKGAASTAKYVAEGVDVHVVTCTGGERGSILNPDDGPPRRAREHLRDPPRGDGARPARSSASARTGWASSTPAGPRATRSRRCPRAASRLVPVEEAAEPLVRLIRELPAARDDDVRRERRLPAPRPRHVPQGQRGGVRGGRRPGALPRRRGAVAAAQALLPPLASTGERTGAARRDDRAPAWSRRTPSGSRSGSPTRRTPPGSPPGCPARSTSRSATGRCSRTPPRSTRTAPGSRCPLDIHQKAWPTEDYELARSLVDSELPEDDLFAGVRELVETMEA